MSIPRKFKRWHMPPPTEEEAEQIEAALRQLIKNKKPSCRDDQDQDPTKRQG